MSKNGISNLSLGFGAFVFCLKFFVFFSGVGFYFLLSLKLCELDITYNFSGL